MGTRTSDMFTDQAVQLESDHFGDIVQAEFEDNYRNLSVKSLAALHWIVTFCNRTRFVLKTDDDAVVNMRALLKHLGDIGRPSMMVLCRIWTTMTVLRDDPKWKVRDRGDGGGGGGNKGQPTPKFIRLLYTFHTTSSLHSLCGDCRTEYFIIIDELIIIE